MKTDFDISIIVPFLNEEDNVAKLGLGLTAFYQAHPDLSIETILVNDGSTDNSTQKIQQSSFPRHTKLINLSQNFGSHAALRAGIGHTSGAFVTFLYADLQDPIENITAMYEKTKRGIDIVWASRAETSNSFFEKLFSKFYSLLMKKYVNKRYPEKGFDVVMFSRKVAGQLNHNVEGNSSIFLQILNFGFKHDFIEYEKKRREAGKSKWTLSKKVKLLIDSFVAFSFAPIRLVSFTGILFFVAGSMWSAYLIIRKLTLDDLTSGWPALYSTLLLGFGISNISLGIIAEYLWRTLDASRRRPVFIIDEIIELKND